jgi:hypothetical protein
MAFINRVASLGRRASFGVAQRTPVEEKTIRSDRIQVERKVFTVSLRENPRGRFLRITEDVAGRRDNIIIPAPGLEEFAKLLAEFAQTSAATPMEIATVDAPAAVPAEHSVEQPA